MKAFFSALRKVEAWAAALFLVGFTIVAVLQVTFRLCMNPLPWSEELCKFLFFWCTFIGAIVVSSNDGHFKVDYFVLKFPAKVQTFLRYFSYALVALFCGILIYYGIILMQSNVNRVSAAMGLPMHYVYTIIPINGCLVLLHLVEQILKDVGLLDKKEA